MFHDHNEMQFEFNNRNITEKSPIVWKLNCTVLNNQWVKEYVKREVIKCFEIIKMKIQHIKIYDTDIAYIKYYLSQSVILIYIYSFSI